MCAKFFRNLFGGGGDQPAQAIPAKEGSVKESNAVVKETALTTGTGDDAATGAVKIGAKPPKRRGVPGLSI